MSTAEQRIDALEASLASLRVDGAGWVHTVQSESQKLQDSVQIGVAQIGAESTARLAELTGQLQVLFTEVKQEFDKHRGELQNVAGNWVSQQTLTQQGLRDLAEETKKHVDSLLTRVQSLETSVPGVASRVAHTSGGGAAPSASGRML